MSIVDAAGRYMPERADRKPDPQMSADMILIGLRARKMSIRKIAKMFNTSHQTVLRRWEKIPPDVRSHYAKSLD